MPILIRLNLFFIWALAAAFVDRLLVLNVFALDQWAPSIDETLNTTTTSLGVKATRTCTRLRGELGSDVVQVYGEREYVEAIQNPASLFNTVQRPACVVAPRKDVHVQKAMAAIYHDRVRYAIMSGGHTGMTGWNTYVCLVTFPRGFAQKH